MGASLVSRETKEQDPEPRETDFLKNIAAAAQLSRTFVWNSLK